MTEPAFNPRAGAWAGDYGQGAANHGGTIRHHAHARARTVLDVGIKTGAVVLDRQRTGVFGKVRGHDNAPGGGMFDGVRDCLLGDAVKVQGGVGITATTPRDLN